MPTLREFLFPNERECLYSWNGLMRGTFEVWNAIEGWTYPEKIKNNVEIMGRLRAITIYRELMRNTHN